MSPNKPNDSDPRPEPGVVRFVTTSNDPYPLAGPNDRRYWHIDLTVNEREVKTLRRALKRLRHEIERENERNERKGWQPAPGRVNVVTMTRDTIEDLLGRLPHPGFEQRGDQ